MAIDFETMWADLKARDAQRAAEFYALSKEVRERLEKEFIDPENDRFSEDPLFGDDYEDED